MTGCSCPHSVIEHGTAELFGTSMCLRLNCDCNGTNEEIEAERLAKQVVKIAADVIAGFDMEIL